MICLECSHFCFAATTLSNVALGAVVAVYVMTRYSCRKLVFLYFSVYNNCIPVIILHRESWYYKIGSRNILGMLSKVVRYQIGKTQARILLVTKGWISKKFFDLVNWWGSKECMRYIPLGTKVGQIKFVSCFYCTGKMMKKMRA